MSIHKNFKINRNKTPEQIIACDVKHGDVFEREGSLHMRIDNCMGNNNITGKIWICNLNTGSVWAVSSDEVYTPVKNCEINYDIKG